MKRELVFMCALVVLTGFCAPAASAGVPQMINYQGTLTDVGGTVVPNGNYSIEFKIYDVASGGASLWSEKWDTTTSQVPVVGGTFNVMLGFQNPIPASFFADHPVTYLGIKVGTDSEMLPRQQITSVGYAFTAGNGVPKGGIIMWSGTIDGNGSPIINGVADTSWHICNGTGGTPNLTDKFIMGAGGTYAVGNTGGEKTHILTVAEMPAHAHKIGGHYFSKSGTGTQFNSVSNYPDSDTSLTGETVGGGGAHNNLPPYFALAFIMKL